MPEEPRSSLERLSEVAQYANIANWPKTTDLRVGPQAIDKTLLLEPTLIDREHKSFSIAPMKGNHWVVTRWSWDDVTHDDESVPAELPSAYKRRLLNELPPSLRNDADLVDQYLERKLEKYRKSKLKSVAGTLNLKICVAPNPEAAYEYLIYESSMNVLPTDVVKSMFAESKRRSDLGALAFVRRSGTTDYRSLKFVRDNIAVCLTAGGTLVEEAEPLAHKLDKAIALQPSVMYADMLARRPRVSVHSAPDESSTKGSTFISYDTAAPLGQDVLFVRAYVGDQKVAIKNGKILLQNKKGKVKIKLVAVTSELLANSVEQEVVIDE